MKLFKQKNGKLSVELRAIHPARQSEHPEHYTKLNVEYIAYCHGCSKTPIRGSLRQRHTYMTINLKEHHDYPNVHFKCIVCKDEEIDFKLSPMVITTLADDNFNLINLIRSMKRIYDFKKLGIAG